MFNISFIITSSKEGRCLRLQSFSVFLPGSDIMLVTLQVWLSIKINLSALRCALSNLSMSSVKVVQNCRRVFQDRPYR